MNVECVNIVELDGNELSPFVPRRKMEIGVETSMDMAVAAFRRPPRVPGGPSGTHTVVEVPPHVAPWDHLYIGVNFEL